MSDAMDIQQGGPSLKRKASFILAEPVRKKSKLSEPQKAQVKKTIKQILANHIQDKLWIAAHTASVDFVGGVYHITAIPQGVTERSRVGNSIRPKRLRMRIHAGIGDNTNMVRMVVFRWHPSAAAGVPTVYSILEDTAPTAFVGTSNAPLMPYNWADKQMYTVLWDRTFVLDAQSPQQAVVNLELYGKKLNPRINYVDASTSAVLNGLYVMYISDSGAVSHPTLTFTSELTFEDA